MFLSKLHASLENIATIYVKEYRQLKRDRRTLSVIIFIPTLMLLLYGYALNFDVKHVRFAAVDESCTAESRNFIRQFSSTEYFQYVGNLQKQDELDQMMRNGNITVGMVVPDNFAKAIISGRSVEVQFIIDGTNSNTATLVLGYIKSIVQNYSSGIVTKYFIRKGVPVSPIALDYRPRVYYNPELSSAKFLVPGLIGFILTVLSVVSTSVSVVREKERGTLEHILLAPIKSYEIILGKTLLYFLLAAVAVILVLSTSFVLFDIVVRGSIVLLSLTIVIFLIGTLSLGVLISTFTTSQQMAYLVSSLITLLPTFILSGFVFPIRSMPQILQFVTYLVPARYFLAALRAIILKGASLPAISNQIGPLLIFAIIFPLISSYRLNRKGF
ncbi:MAG: ABC transporter permease [Candidatus Kryptoniota bacterium]